MSNFIGRPPFSNSLWVGIETMQFHIAQTKIFLRTPSFPIQGVPMNNLAPMKNCPGGVQGNLNWMPGYFNIQVKVQNYCKVYTSQWNFGRAYYSCTLNYLSSNLLCSLFLHIYYSQVFSFHMDNVLLSLFPILCPLFAAFHLARSGYIDCILPKHYCSALAEFFLTHKSVIVHKIILHMGIFRNHIF